MHELSLISSHTSTTFARLGPSHGYRIDGDAAAINAEIDLAAGGLAATPALALQLWACEEPYQGGALSGFKVAETRVQVPGAQQSFWHDAVTFARPPATARDYAMVLVLAAQQADGLQVFDFANYPQRQRFVVPHMQGSAGYQLGDADSVSLHVARIFNPRDEPNLSGSLSLQLWAQPDPYRSGEPRGTQLASVELGQLSGQASLELIEQRAPLSRPGAGETNVVLLLCEWSAEGYLVRDYCNFAEPYAGPTRAPVSTPVEVAAAPAAVAKPAAIATPSAAAAAPATKSVVTAAVAEKPVAQGTEAKPAAAAPAQPVVTAAVAEKPVAPAPEAKPALAAVPAQPVVAAAVAEKSVAPAPEAKPAVVAAPVKPVASAAVAEKPVAPAPEAKPVAARPSLNQVDEAELMKAAEVPKKMAAALIKARPFRSFDDLLKVRGIGESTVQRLRALFTL